MDSDEDSDDTTAAAPAPSAPAPASASAPAPASTTGSGIKTSPIPPSFTSIGSPEVPTHQELQQMRMPAKGSAPPQLVPAPQGDEYPAVAKVEGLMDKSEAAL
jgi:protein phosphatase 2C family protein 2/3